MLVIYSGQGSSKTCVQSLQLALPKAICMDAKELLMAFKNKEVKTLLMPGGADLPYIKALKQSGMRQIKRFVQAGGFYVGICAGSYFGSASLFFRGQRDEDTNVLYVIKGPRLKLLPVKALGSIPVNGRFYEDSARAIFKTSGRFSGKFYYHGGAYFKPLPRRKSPVEVLAKYEVNNEAAIVFGNCGKGKVFLCGLHFESCAKLYEQSFGQDEIFKLLEKNPDKDKIFSFLKEQMK